MSLEESQALLSVHPWLRVRLEWIKEVYELVGGEATIISGRRSLSQQRELYDTITGRPVAFPGCSQHNYGFAADISFGIIIITNRKGFIPKTPASVTIISPQESIAYGNSLARHVGLHLVANDDGHVQMYNGRVFKTWAVDLTLCDPNPPLGRALAATIRRDLEFGLSLFQDAVARRDETFRTRTRISPG